MVAEKRDPPARPGGRTEKLETALRNALEQRNSEQSKRALAEHQRDQLREALEDAVSEVEVMKNEIGYRAATIDVIADCRAALKATEEG